MANFSRLLNRSQPNFLCRRQMGCNRKHGIKRLKSMEVRLVGQKNVTFWRDPLTLYPTWGPNEGIFQKATLNNFGRINSVPDGENRTKSAKPCPGNVGVFVHPYRFQKFEPHVLYSSPYAVCLESLVEIRLAVMIKSQVDDKRRAHIRGWVRRR